MANQVPSGSSINTQMRSLKDEFDSLQEVKDVEMERLERELREANEEIHNLRLDAEEAAALHENEIAGMQEELCRLKAELDRVQLVRNEYDMEVTALRAEINMKKGPDTGDSQTAPETVVMAHADEHLSSAAEEVARLQEELRTVRAQYQDLTDEYQILQESNTIMVHQLERLEAIKYRTRTKSDDSQSFDSDSDSDLDTVNPHIRRVSIARRNTLQSGGSVSFKSVEIMGVGSEYDDVKMEKLEEESEYDLQCQLEKEEKKVELVQAQHDPPQDSLYVREIKSQASHTDRKSRVKEKKKKDVIEEREEDENKCDQAQHSLRELEGKCQLSQTEWEQLHEELRLCKEEIERLNGTIPIGGRVPAGGMKPFALFVVMAGALFLYPCLKRCSHGWMAT